MLNCNDKNMDIICNEYFNDTVSRPNGEKIRYTEMNQSNLIHLY